MNYTPSFGRGCLLLAGLLPLLLLLTRCQPGDVNPDASVRVAATDTLTLAQVRAMTRTDAPGYIYLSDAGKQGVFNLDLADHATADNTGMVLVTAAGRRYRRQYSGPVSAGWFDVRTNDDDISAELQAAVNATIGELVIPDGQYTQRKEVRLHSNLTLRGNPDKVTITLPTTYVSLTNPVSTTASLENVLIQGINWVVTAKGVGTYGVIAFDGPTILNLTVQQCRSDDRAAEDSTNFLTVKIQAGKTASNIIVRQNDVRAKRIGCEIFNHDNYNVYAGTGIVVTDNTFQDCHFGISLSGPMDDNLVANNYLRNCSLYGIEIAGALRNVRILNNRFEGTFDKFLEGSNDGNGNGSIQGGLVITDNQTVGTCTGGIQLFNAGAAKVSNNVFAMTGRLEIISGSSSGGTYTGNRIESGATHAIICDNAPNNTFQNNSISNKSAQKNLATFRAYGSKSTGISVIGNRFAKGPGGNYLDSYDGAVYAASQNTDENGQLIQQ